MISTERETRSSAARLQRGIRAVKPVGSRECFGDGRFVDCGEYGVYFSARWGQRADGVGGGGVAGQEQSLAAAAAKVLFAAVARFARFLHPGFATELLEGRGIFPDFAQAAVSYVLEVQFRNNLRGMTGKRFARGRDEHELATPAAHARLGISGVIVRNDILDANFPAQAQLRALEKFDGMGHLFARGQQALAIGERPSVILHVGKLHAGGAGGFGEGQHFRELIDVAPVDYEVEGDGDAATFQPLEHAKFLCVGLRAGNFRGDFLARALKTELQMVEAGGEEGVEPGFVERKAGGDEIDIQAGGAGGADELDDVGAGEGFAARGKHATKFACRARWRATAVRRDWSNRRSAAGSGGLARRSGLADSG